MVAMLERTRIGLTGGDRAKFLNNLCTNDVRKLREGQGCEAFLTTVQGKTIGHVLIFCQASSIVIDTVPGQAERILQHLEKYLIREDVELADWTSTSSALLLAGAEVGRLDAVVKGGLPRELLDHADTSIGDVDVSVRRVPFTCPDAFLIVAPRSHLERVQHMLQDHGATDCSGQALEIARVEAGFPWYGQDINEANLPQEVGRDQQAISFTKGCYLGQETVARIDALGHVNRMLVQVRFTPGPVPQPNDELRKDDLVVGRVTSAVHSPKFATPLALAYVRRPHHAPGSPLTWSHGQGVVVEPQ
jgi:folate-binding protein YgfZ